MRLFDTYTRQLLTLPPPPGPIGMYVCGPTVYQRVHIGNGRPFVVAMWLRRWLRESGYEATLVNNITDINDKIYKAAGDGSSAELAERASEWYLEDTDALGLGRADVYPKATESVDDIVALIQELVAGGHAYEAGGDVYFRVARYADYGRLSGRTGEDSVRNPSEEEEPSELKEDARDFALWKAHKPDEDTWWESPWGRGRPGWHIECSAMAEKFLGPRFEIHGGGNDLIFPHHENEIAQSRGAGREFARIWMHNGMLQLTGEKMSKSIGNIVSLHDAIEHWGRETLLVYFLGAHWRKPIDFSEDALEQAKAQADGFRNAFLSGADGSATPGWGRFAEALDDDFNTPEALAVMHEWRADAQLELLRRALGIFGLESLAETSDAPAELEELARRRADARSRGDYGEADRLRQQIEAQGWEVRDVGGGFQLVPR
jgi:cysteinyl-tRNA synthetase